LANVKDIDRGLKKFMRELQHAKNLEVVIGLQEGDTNGELSIAEYAAYNEYGTGKIPERSFMRSTFDEKVSDINRDIDNKYRQVQAGKMNIYSALNLVGLRHGRDIQKKIGSNISPANSPMTIAKKGSGKTLIDTGAMINAVRHIVRVGK